MAKPPLSADKKKWAQNRNVTLKGKTLNYNVSQQMRYVKALRELLFKMSDVTQAKVIKLFKSNVARDYLDDQDQLAAMDESIASKAKKLMNELTDRFTKLFTEKAPDLASTMVDDATKSSKSTLQMSLKELSGGLTLKTSIVPAGAEEASKAIINENVLLIKSIPAKYFNDVTGAVMRSITAGAGVTELIPQLKRFTAISDRRVKNLALDQTRKAYAFLNKQRLMSLGVKQFVWQHSGGGQHPRQSHIALDGKTFSYDNLPVINKEQVDRGYESPVTGIPGQAINCRCTMKPVIVFDDGD